MTLFIGKEIHFFSSQTTHINTSLFHLNHSLFSFFDGKAYIYKMAVGLFPEYLNAHFANIIIIMKYNKWLTTEDINFANKN